MLPVAVAGAIAAGLLAATSGSARAAAGAAGSTADCELGHHLLHPAAD